MKLNSPGAKCLTELFFLLYRLDWPRPHLGVRGKFTVMATWADIVEFSHALDGTPDAIKPTVHLPQKI